MGYRIHRRRILPKDVHPETLYHISQIASERLAAMFEDEDGWDEDGDELSWHEFEAEVKALSEATPGVLYRFDIHGEGDFMEVDMSRLWARDGRVVVQEPEIVWGETPALETP